MVGARAVDTEPEGLDVAALVATAPSFQDGDQPTSGYAGTPDTMLEEGTPDATKGGDAPLSVDGDGASGLADRGANALRVDAETASAGRDCGA